MCCACKQAPVFVTAFTVHSVGLRRYGYSSIWEMQEVVDNYTAAGIPLDVMWGSS